MVTKIFSFVFMITSMISYGQSFERKWGTMIPVYDQPLQAFSGIRKILNTPFVAEVNPKTGNLFLINEYYDEILEFNQKNANSKLFYKIPKDGGPSYIQQIKFDSENNIVISGKTFNGDLATKNAFSEEMISTIDGGYSFLAKISKKGVLLWFTYFYEIPEGTMALTIDKNDDIYVLNKRFRGDILDENSFQKKGDIHSKYDFQDAITKFNGKGERIWSTFYAKDNSKINAIMASDNGLFIYGEHLMDKFIGSSFGTKDSYQESLQEKSDKTSGVFLSKFDFSGNRVWSTYFGNENSYIPIIANNIVKNPYNITVIGDDAYIVTTHKKKLGSKVNQNFASENSFLSTPPFSNENYTLTKFLGNGKKDWTTYLYTPGALVKSFDNKELFISAPIDETSSSLKYLSTKNGFQTKNMGMQDVYTYAISIDGKELKHGTFYGFKGNDIGFSLPSKKGFYTIGFSNYYTEETSLFATKKAPLTKFKLYDTNVYVGNYVGYFQHD